MGSGSLGELAEGGGGGGDGFEFMFDVSDLLTDNNIEMPSHENIIESYLTSLESVEWPPFPGSDTLQENQISSYHDEEYNNYQGLENVQLENNLNSVQSVETFSLNPPSVLHAHDHEAAAAHADNVLPSQNMSSQLLQSQTTQETESSIQGCPPIYVVDQSLQSIRNNHFSGPSQNKVGIMDRDSSLINQQDFTWVPQNQNCPYHPSPQSGPHPTWCSNSPQPPHSSFQPQELDQVTVIPTVIADSAPMQMRLTFRPQMQTTRCVFYPQSHNTNSYDQPSLVSRPQEAQFQRSANEANGFNVLNPNEGAQQIQIVVSMPQEVHLQVLPNESAGPGFSSLNERPSNQIQIIVSGLQGLQPRGSMPTPTAAPIVHINPIQGIYDQQNQFMPTDQGLNIEVSVPQLLEESSRAQNQFRRLAQHTHPRPQMELGESSTRPRKRVTRRDHQLPSGLNHPQQVSDIFRSQGIHETRDNKRRALNHLYDPLYEGIGLPIDPHLRRFVAPKKEENDMGSTMSLGEC